MVEKHRSYSKTPLVKKLGIQENAKIWIINEPANYFKLLGVLPPGVHKLTNQKVKKDFIHYFARSMKQLEIDLLWLKSEMEVSACIWISWCKKSSKIATDITEDKIRDLAIRTGLVDVKVCSIDEQWSGLKLVIPRSQR